MNRKKVLELIEAGEGINVEFKQRFSSFEKMAKEMIAFANTRGGYLLLGIDDDKSVYGIESEKGDYELIKETAEKYCEPPLQFNSELFELNGRDILIIKVSESDQKPHRIQDYKPNLDLNSAVVYVRVNDKSVLAGKEMIKIMQTQTSGRALKNYTFGSDEKIVLSYLEKFESITVKELCKLANISYRRASRTLIKLVRANILLIHIKDNGESYFTSAGAL